MGEMLLTSNLFEGSELVQEPEQGGMGGKVAAW